MPGHDAETERVDTVNRHLAEWRAGKQKAKRLVTALSCAQATQVTTAPSSSFSAAVNTNALGFNRAKKTQQQQQKALWYNNFKMGNYRKMKKFVREKLRGMVKRIKYLQAGGETFFRISQWRLKTNAHHVSRILWEGQRKPALKEKWKGLHLKTRMHPLSTGSIVQIQTADKLNKLIKIHLF